MAFRITIPVRFGDVDPASIVYYPRFLHYCHIAMEELLQEALGISYAELTRERSLGFPTVRVEADYRRPLRYGDLVEVETAIERLGGSSVTWRYRLYRRGEDDPVATVRVVTVAVDMRDLSKRELPPWVREALAGHAVTPAPPGEG